MGRTLYGVDLEASPFGGLVRRLLTEEELETLADGGRPADGDPDESEFESDAADSGGGAFDAEGDPAGGVGANDDFEVGVGVGVGGPESPPPNDPGSDDEGGVGGFLASRKGLLLKGSVVLVLLAVVGVLVWRYGDRLKTAVPGVGGDADDGTVPPPTEGDLSGRERVEDAGSSGDPDADEDTTASAGATGDATRDRSGEGDESVDRGEEADVDLGALVGLGTLALVAAVVRKFGEDRPRDPLVDGPDEE